MTGRGKGSPLPVVGLVAIAAAALLFLGVWTQAGRVRDWANEPAHAHNITCQTPLRRSVLILLDRGKSSCYHTFQA